MNERLTKLTEEFPAEEVHLLAKQISQDGTRCLALAYLDARHVSERLTEVFGIGGWSVSHEVVSEKCVKTRLRILDTEYPEAVFEDFGYSDAADNQPQPEHLKAAASDGLKRAAVLLGVGRYLYRLGRTWCDYDAEARQPVPKNLAELLRAAPAKPPAKAEAPALAAKPPIRPCPACKTGTLRLRPAGVSKKGEPYEAFWSCSRWQEGCQHTEPAEE